MPEVTETMAPAPGGGDTAVTDDLARQAAELGPAEAARFLSAYPDQSIVSVLQALNPSKAQDILAKFYARRHNTVIAAASPELRQQWLRNDKYPENTVGRLIEPAGAIFYPDVVVSDAIDQLRELVKATFI